MQSTPDRDGRRARMLEYATIVWNAGEAFLTIGVGIAAASLALVGFGADSIIEIFASGVVIWHLLPGHPTTARTRRALRLVALAFLALAVALIFAATWDLTTGRRAGESLFGLIYLGVTAVVMFALATWKRRLAERTSSAPLRAEARMTFLDGILALATLVGLALNAYLRWWWADPMAALLVAIAALNEARENWLGAGAS